MLGPELAHPQFYHIEVITIILHRMVHFPLLQALYIVFPDDIYSRLPNLAFYSSCQSTPPSFLRDFQKKSNAVEQTLGKKYCPFKSLSQASNTFVHVNMPVRIFTVALKIDVFLHQSFILLRVNIIHFLAFAASMYSGQV